MVNFVFCFVNRYNMDTLNDYHKERNRKASLLVEEMKQKPSSLEEMREQTQRILSDKIIDMKTENNNTEMLSFVNGKNIDRNKYQILFDEIEGSKTADNLTEIAKRYDLKIDDKKYPKLDFYISKEEIAELKAQKKISIDESNSNYLSFNQNDLDPLAKLLYSIIWKQGDLQKLKHIIAGIEDVDNIKEDKDNALVFYYFGNHLASKTEDKYKYPIIDQHVIRAFNAYKLSNNPVELDVIRKKTEIVKEDRHKYLEWIDSNFKDKGSDFLYYLDKLLFEIGKKIKLSKNSL